jgi:pimeloyl-ACP methyl ester carboxylesterase
VSRTPLTVAVAMRQLRIGWIRNRYLMFGMMAKKPIPQPIVDGWFEAALRDKRIRLDLIKYCRTRFDKANLARATERMADFDGEVLVLWSHNPVMPDDHATRLADLTQGTLRYVDDANVLIMLDAPEQTAREIGEFLARRAHGKDE